MPDPSTLRVGVLCGHRSVQRWQAEAVARLFAVRGVAPAVWIALQQEAAASAPRRTKKPGTSLFARIAQLLPQPMDHDALNEQDPAPLLAQLRTLAVHTNADRCELDADVIAALTGLQLDLVLVLSDFRPDAAELGHPRLGAWSFHPGLFRNSIHEDLFRDPATAALQLIRYDATGDVRVLREGSFVGAMNEPPVDAALMNCARWPAQVAMEVLAGNADAASGLSGVQLAPDIAPRGSMGSLGAYGRAWRRKLFRPNSELSAEWNIGVLHQPITSLLDENASMNVRWLPPPSKGKSRSEPFGYTSDDGQLNVLYRKHSGTTGQSSIARLRPKADNVLKRSRPMLEGAGITGYPYVLEHEGAVHVVVTHTTGTELYRLNEANDGLDRVAILIDLPLHAPTLFHTEGRWWLFATDPALPDCALLAFHAQHLHGPYTAHPLNPLKLDARSARPAGTPFQRDGVWWRPALDASRHSTSAIVLNRIITLTPDLFSEKTVKRIEPFRGTSYGHGLRTLCAMGPITLVDGLRSPTVAANKANANRDKKRSGSSNKRK